MAEHETYSVGMSGSGRIGDSLGQSAMGVSSPGGRESSMSLDDEADELHRLHGLAAEVRDQGELERNIGRQVKS